MLALHSGSAVDGTLARGLTFELEEDDRWLLRGRRAQEVLDAWRGDTCDADPDELDLTSWYESAIEELGAHHVACIQGPPHDARNPRNGGPPARPSQRRPRFR